VLDWKKIVGAFLYRENNSFPALDLWVC